MTGTWISRGRLTRGATLLVVALMLAAFALYVFGGSGGAQRQLVAEFASTDGLYTGAPVKVLGVQVGTVTSIRSEGSYVRVVISYRASQPMPANVGAVIVQPSVVGDRYVQMVPAYTGGAQLADHATLTMAHTQIPVTLDQTYAALTQLATALGPNGANKSGALSDLLKVGAANLAGNGTRAHDTITQLAALLSTLSAKRADITATVDNLSTLAGSLAADDPQVRQLATNLALVSQQLDGQRTNLSAALNALDPALQQVAAFVKANRSALTTGVQQLSTVAAAVASQKSALDDILKVAPLGISNLDRAYNAQNWDQAHPTVPLNNRLGALQSRGNFFNDITVQLASTLQGACATLLGSTGAAGSALKPLCTLLTAAGSGVGSVLQNLLGGLLGKGNLTAAAAPKSLGDLMIGASG